MKSYQIAVLFVIVALPSLHAADQKKERAKTTTTKSASPATSVKSVTLKDGRIVTIENGRVMLAQGGKPTLMPGGRYITREGKVLLVGNEGRLTNSASLKAEAPPEPEQKRATPTSSGQRHQTGSNL